MHAFPAAQRPSENPQTRFSDGLLFFPPAPNRVRGRAAHPPYGKSRLKKQKTGWKPMPILFFAFFRRPFFQTAYALGTPICPASG
ncbi:hypothetical protein [Neisseria bacilliformis]|uniref:hypothetical protein n=1 Tax=Neisseria bacilliformis TaxID=267212 RepID=UPI0028E4E235|nr:hypothetical protein [Neisseria bacilliformis]